MINKETGCYHAVISHLRPHNVPLMTDLCGEMTWLVGKGEADSYRQNGAKEVIESGGLCESRNHALEMAFKQGAPCVQISDDLKKIELGLAGVEGAKRKQLIPVTQAISLLLKRTQEIGFKCAGVAPTPNLFYFNPDRLISINSFIVGDLILVLPSSPRFDENLKLKEDYDFTLAHIQLYGGVVRANDLLATFLHRTNKGGAVAVRSAELEQQSIAYLKNKWPGKLRDNPRRPNEILLVKAKQ